MGIQESHEMRFKEFYAQVGYLHWVLNVTAEKMQIIVPPLRIKLGSKYYTQHIAIKAGFTTRKYRHVIYLYLVTFSVSTHQPVLDISTGGKFFLFKF